MPDLDAKPRCWWATGTSVADPLMVAYHDDEWGVPVHDDTDLFERLALEGFQAGLSWSTILRKRQSFREAFRGFDPAVVAAFDDGDRETLMADAGIVRNRAKIDATIDNAAGGVRPGPATTGSPAARHLVRPDPGHHAGVGCLVARSQEARLSVRRLDDRLRVHA